jgi:ribosomal protein L7/L12
LVEVVPQIIKKDVNKEAEKLRSALEAAGGVVELE